VAAAVLQVLSDAMMLVLLGGVRAPLLVRAGGARPLAVR
jgi:hypothetical protein